MSELRTLVIGDVHGHVDRLAALLIQEGIIDDRSNRINHDVRVIQLGDLGNFGVDFTNDEQCYRSALEDHWVDTVLWGNHDRAVYDPEHFFSGYAPPIGPVRSYMNRLIAQGRYKFAAHAHGYLLTHAGLHSYFDQSLPDTLEDAVDLLNHPPVDPGAERNLSGFRSEPDLLWAVVNGVGYTRGGSLRTGGILWRDISEDLSAKFNQIFGHSAQQDGEVKHLVPLPERGIRPMLGRTEMDAWCVDIGGKHENRLAGIWLPDLTVVKVTHAHADPFPFEEECYDCDECSGEIDEDVPCPYCTEG